MLMGSAAPRAEHPVRRRERRWEPLLSRSPCPVLPGAGPLPSEGHGDAEHPGSVCPVGERRRSRARQLSMQRRFRCKTAHRKGVYLLRPSPDPSCLPLHQTLASPEASPHGVASLPYGSRDVAVF